MLTLTLTPTLRKDHCLSYKLPRAFGSGELINEPSTSTEAASTSKQEASAPQFAHLSKTAVAYLQMQCNILPGQKFDRALKG